MKIDPFELEERKPLADGPANFEILSALDVVSKKKADIGEMTPDQMKIIFRVWDKDGVEGVVTDYVPYELKWKLSAFLRGIGKPELSKTGNIDTVTFAGICGKFILKTKTSAEYGARINVSEYVTKEVKKENPSTEPELDDDIPF